jgi:hypothetical protein
MCVRRYVEAAARAEEESRRTAEATDRRKRSETEAEVRLA